MPDILQIFSDYLSKKIDESKEGIFKVKIPQDLIEHVVKFYLQPYLTEMNVTFYEKTIKIEGTNIISVCLGLEIGEIQWEKERKTVEIRLDVSDIIYKFVRFPLQTLVEKTNQIVTVDEKKVRIDIEKLLNLKPQWNSITYTLRNKVKLTDMHFVNGSLELVFEKAMP